MAVKVISPGLSTTVQDLGRHGYYHLGIPMGGGMDMFALRCANLLVGNDEGAAALEAVYMGPELEFTSDGYIAVTGADMPFRIDGEFQESWVCCAVRAGQRLSFDYLKSGARAYIAVSGGIDVPVVLGSRSTYALGRMGGFEGRALMEDDVIPVLSGNGKSVKAGRNLPPGYRREQPATTELRVISGMYMHRITDESRTNFFSDVWKVSTEADRIGYRFMGGEKFSFLERKQPFGAGSDPSNIVDSCYPYGSIQIPGGAEPIILHRDAVSGGGFAVIGTVISADMDLIGQLQPNMESRFVEVSMEQALAAREDRQQLLDRARQHLS
ncbi:MAG: biotin-dependent carboxyltransferase family protein [Gammaproteobacteria bacterium]|nr:biotin-dependent carboxyltransferase family protein [Gammaproteobacteria bacterium]MDE0511107.1 biotin-dependent carboxyltransferase family protein [Gammaproteobacteria bacterium]